MGRTKKGATAPLAFSCSTAQLRPFGIYSNKFLFMLYFRSAQKKGGERLSSLPSLVSYAHVSKRTPDWTPGVLLKIFSPQAGCLGGDFRAGSTMAATGDAASGDGRAGRAKHSFIPSSLPCLPVRVQVLSAISAVTARQARRNFPVVLRPDNPGDGENKKGRNCSIGIFMLNGAVAPCSVST